MGLKYDAICDKSEKQIPMIPAPMTTTSQHLKFGCIFLPFHEVLVVS